MREGEDAVTEELGFYLTALEGLHAPPPAARTAIRVAASLRRLQRVTAGSTAPEDVLEDVANAVDSLATRLEPFETPSGVQWALALAGPAGRYLCHPLTGPANALAPPIEVAFNDGYLTGSAAYGKVCEGKFGMVHPSFIAAGIVTIVSLISVSSGRRGALQTLDIRFAGAAALESEIHYEAFIATQNEELTEVQVKVRVGETKVADASARFLAPTG